MEVYILDNLYRRQTVVDVFQSFIWTERFAQYGDFELSLFSTLENRNLFQKGTKLAIAASAYVMIVETVEDSIDSNGIRLLKLSGRSLEAILDSRLARGSLTDLTSDPKWILTGTPKEIATQMFHDICVTGILHPSDVIPLIHEGSIFPEDTISPPTDIIEYDVSPTTLYTATKNLCDQYLMGFRLVRNQDAAQLYYDIYTGSDRTTHQSVLPPVLFSPDLDNLQNTSELTSIATYKNVAYVFSPVGCEIVYTPEASSSTTGFDRQILMVQADDITDTDPAVASAQMIQRGYQELAKNRRISAFDGEITQYSSYVYGRDYYLGDMVQLKNTDGVMNDMQVTEHIFVSDENGDRSYPTLTITQFVTPGSWLALPPDKVWSDYGSTDYWANQ